MSSHSSPQSAIINSNELKVLIQSDTDLVLLDATYGEPVYYTIPGAQYFDIDAVADQSAPFAHTIPTADDFQMHARAFGINNDSKIIVFDRHGFWMAAARVWWMFRLFGHHKVYVLNGGLSSWDGAVEPLQDAHKNKGNFTAALQAHLYKSLNDVTHNTNDTAFLLVDARPAQAFEAGHIPHSISVPMPDIIGPNGTLKDKHDLLPILKPILESDRPIATTCGSGVTACALALAAYECGVQDVAVFDGSWTEWRAFKQA